MESHRSRRWLDRDGGVPVLPTDLISTGSGIMVQCGPTGGFSSSLQHCCLLRHVAVTTRRTPLRDPSPRRSPRGTRPRPRRASRPQPPPATRQQLPPGPTPPRPPLTDRVRQRPKLPAVPPPQQPLRQARLPPRQGHPPPPSRRGRQAQDAPPICSPLQTTSANCRTASSPPISPRLLHPRGRSRWGMTTWWVWRLSRTGCSCCWPVAPSSPSTSMTAAKRGEPMSPPATPPSWAVSRSKTTSSSLLLPTRCWPSTPTAAISCGRTP